MPVTHDEAKDVIRTYAPAYLAIAALCVGAFGVAVSGVLGDAEAAPPTTDSAQVEYSVPEHTGS